MRRREFITLLGGAGALSVAARAEQLALPVIGFIGSRIPDTDARLVAAFRSGLGEVGYAEGRNVTIKFHWVGGQYDRLPSIVADLIRRQVAVIAAMAGTPSALAAKAATTTIPIVFNVGVDPVAAGLVTSINRPGGNITGGIILSAELVAKRVELMHELLPTASVIALLINPTNPTAETEKTIAQDAARSLGLQLHVLSASNASKIEDAFRTLVEIRAEGLVVHVDPYFTNQFDQIVALATRHTVPAIYGWPEAPIAGGLMSYGPSIAETYHLAGVYSGRIVKGEKPGDLPVQQVVKVELVINLKTAKSLGVTFPITLLGRADKVIE
jgi:putative tryptophan/tyrosine transport system substrate-binding protein